MSRRMLVATVVMLFGAAMAFGAEPDPELPPTSEANADVKELSGMSIVGNEEAPKALYIVPWKSSGVGGETRLDLMVTEDDSPVDREVFKRQIDFYRVSTEP